MPFVIVFIVAVAALMGWKFLQPECPGGSIVGIEEQCRATFGAAFCATAWPETERIARRSGATYKTQSECLEQWPVCIERSDAAAWAPRPANFCISRAPDGSVARIEPVYSKR